MAATLATGSPVEQQQHAHKEQYENGNDHSTQLVPRSTFVLATLSLLFPRLFSHWSTEFPHHSQTEVTPAVLLDLPSRTHTHTQTIIVPSWS